MDFHALGFIAGLMLAWGALLIGAVKWLLDRYHTDIITHRFGKIEGVLAEMERKTEELKSRLSAEYVLRDDWVRFAGTIDAKMDRLYGAVDTMKELIHARN